jgi:hypothetical protein
VTLALVFGRVVLGLRLIDGGLRLLTSAAPIGNQ